MVYENVRQDVFLRRPNRFIAEIEIEGAAEICHVKNTGRCRELLLPGASVYVNKALNPRRATQYDLISVYKGQRLINMDSGAPNHASGEFLRQCELTLIKPETKYGASRFDFYADKGGRKAFIEVKGVTLEEKSPKAYCCYFALQVLCLSYRSL